VTDDNVVDLAAERNFNALTDRAAAVLAKLTPALVEMLEAGFDDRIVAQILHTVNEEIVRLTLGRRIALGD
jgi:hypothetical protein